MVIKLDVVYAKCRSCGKDVGCGCHLNNGLCPSCYAGSVAKP